MDTIYLATLSRFPTDEERYLLNDYLEYATDLTTALRDLQQTLLNSKGFLWRHEAVEERPSDRRLRLRRTNVWPVRISVRDSFEKLPAGWMSKNYAENVAIAPALRYGRR